MLWWVADASVLGVPQAVMRVVGNKAAPVVPEPGSIVIAKASGSNTQHCRSSSSEPSNRQRTATAVVTISSSGCSMTEDGNNSSGNSTCATADVHPSNINTDPDPHATPQPCLVYYCCPAGDQGVPHLHQRTHHVLRWSGAGCRFHWRHPAAGCAGA
jgi:hypothetical protein